MQISEQIIVARNAQTTGTKYSRTVLPSNNSENQYWKRTTQTKWKLKYRNERCDIYVEILPVESSLLFPIPSSARIINHSAKLFPPIDNRSYRNRSGINRIETNQKGTFQSLSFFLQTLRIKMISASLLYIGFKEFAEFVVHNKDSSIAEY